MSNPSIASKLISVVKGIFGPKEAKEGAAPGTAASGAAAPAAAKDEAVVKAPAPAEAETAADAPAATATETETAATPAPSPAGDDAPAPAASETEVKEPVSAAPAAGGGTAPGAKADPEPPAAVPGQDDSEITREEKTAIADELEAAAAATQIASDDVLEKVRKEAAPAAENLAVPGYDGLSLPSIRARLRKLTLDEVRELRAYEVAHGERAEFIKMYDNRIAKLQAEPAAE
ncbi:hypothetical protein ACFO4E_01595 [Nocardiopsis mangrovi]|uniref:DUF8129 domain-containing protein n=1 Tax=Nocardiopsis mangrovi TaxID=1179818 RepID=A0ABV9DQR0_9ACTN